VTPSRAGRSGQHSNPDDEPVKESASGSIDNDIATEDEATHTDRSTGADTSDGPEEPEKPGDGQESEAAEGRADSDTDTREQLKAKYRINWSRAVAFGLLPALALLLAAGAAYLKWRDASIRDADVARVESVQAARDSTVALLSYQPDKVDQQLGAARNLLTGQFRDSYTSLTHDVVIPGAKQKKISAVASVPAVASVSAAPSHAVALVFVDQTVIVGNDAPTATASSVRVTLDKINGRWLISGFDPV
jgi:Mce-associated membrane protein